MSDYPFKLDTDVSIWRVDSNITEISGTNFNQVRDAIFKIERELGIKPSGTLNSLVEFLDVSFNKNGTLKSSAFSSVGLVTLPITNNQVGINAGILESKLALDFSTSNLYSMIQSNASLVNSVAANNDAISTKLNSHIGGGPAANLRHVASHIDINAVPNDSRDPTFNWSGLVDKNGDQRPATQVASALLEINNELVDHENSTDDAHTATAISVDASDFQQIPGTVTNVQEALESLDNFNDVTLGFHRATQHSAGVPSDQRTQALNMPDGYGTPVVSVHAVEAYVADFPGTAPIDSVINGDNVIKFLTPATPTEIYRLDAEFSQVKPGDTLRITYGDGYNVEAMFSIDSIRFIPGTTWVVRINGTNFLNKVPGTTARIDRSLFDTNISGVVAAAASNATPTATFAGTGFLGSIIIPDPKSAVAYGNRFDPNKIDESHYKLYLQIYPTGNPIDKVITLPAIDITGNAGTTPGYYTLSGIVESTNNAFRAAGYNFRFTAFEYNGNFGISLTDAIDGVSFSIVNGDASSGTLEEGAFTLNVIGDATDGFDGLGLGNQTSALASPAFRSTFPDSTSALMPTRIIMPRTRASIVDGSPRDYILSAQNDTDGYYEASITNKVITGSTVEVSYTIPLLLQNVGLKTGKTITIQPTVSFTDGLYKDADYGRFIIKSVVYVPDCCSGVGGDTIITVINGSANNGDPLATVSGTGLNVRLYVGNDSVTFNLNNLVDSTATGVNYHRLHEIFETKSATTFSHERARMPIQAGSGLNLDTINFHITDVSPKLRGEIDTSLSEFNRRFLRFYVLDYDSTTGEYDGYLGKKDPSGGGIFNTGPITKARKNLPVRFYDKTYSDFIEIKYVEPASTATAIVSSAQYVDIELFPSLALDDQFLRIATAEINWQPSTGQNIVQNIKDKRPVGSISELEFTQSAKDYINAGNRILHSNGVVRGFDYDYTNPTNDREIFFKGGSALVNGNFVVANEQSATIPYVYLNPPGTLPQGLKWGVCVNESGSLVTIMITLSKQQNFVKAYISTNTYLIDSVTFSELINERKDLCLLYTIDVTIASFTLDTVNDQRRYIAGQSENITLTVGSNDPIPNLPGVNGVTTANFKTFNQAKQWIAQNSPLSLNGKNIYIKVKGTIVIDEEIDLSAYPGITFDGEEGCNILVTSQTGFKVNYNTEFHNMNFIYDGVHTGLSSSNFANFSQGNACIFIDARTSSSFGIKIINCSFTRSLSSQRVPYILASIADSKSFGNAVISGNRFVPGTSDRYNCAIGVYHNSTTSSGYISNVEISNNLCILENSILIISGNINFGLRPTKLNIENNKFDVGVLGFRVEGLSSEFSNITNVSKNSFAIIGTFDTNGKVNISDGSTSRGTGLFNIIENSFNFLEMLILSSVSSSSSIEYVLIEKNKFVYQSSTTAATNWNLTDNYAINVSGVNNGGPPTKINKNIIMKSAAGQYLYGIYYSGVGVEITENILQSSFTGVGIYGGSSFIARINGNTITRGTTNIGRYITCNNSPTLSFITNNIFDSTTIDGSSESTITASVGAMIIGNVNCILTEQLSHHILGGHQPASISSGGANTVESYSKVNTNSPRNYITDILTGVFNGNCSVSYLNGGGSTVGTVLTLPLSSIIPNGARLLSVSFTATLATLYSDWTKAEMFIKLSDNNGATLSSTTYDLVANTVNTYTLTLNISQYARSYCGNNGVGFVLGLGTNCVAIGSTQTINLQPISIKYTY